MKSFLSAGDVLINPTLLAYAAVETDTEGTNLRLGFAGQAGASHCEIRLTGMEARSVLRWLRTNSEFLDQGAPQIRVDRSPGSASRQNDDSSPAFCRPLAIASEK
jgi:hypothetical protein